MAKRRKVLTLRSVVIPDIGTFGTLFSDDHIELCKTVEKEWLDNEARISCIPAGLYKLKKVVSPKYGKCYCLVNAALGVTYNGPSQRTHILIHAANWPRQLLGCIAPGERYMGSQWGVSSSRKALASLEQLLDEYFTETKGNVYMKILRAEQ